jgi:UDP-N-acetylglucosamine--N-acetylmuramyl-(pentapeptide) pyrophosphoryl-undecaprenol N-acetylglucosamine transferase
MLVAAGGTGGHIFPGVAVAREMIARDPSAEVVFVGTARGLETTIVPREGFRLELIESGALKSVPLAKRLTSLGRLPKGFVDAARVLRRFRPDVVVGVGGYASGPIVLLAAFARIPTVVIEPNAMPGFTNRVLARFVRAAAVTFEETQAYFSRCRTVVSGNPVRADFALLPKKERSGALHLLVFGGSQGSRILNNAVVAALDLLHPEVAAGRLAITHQTGPHDIDTVRDAYAKAGVEADVRPFIHEMVEAFGRADVLLCRAGATTAAEVAAAGKAAIFVPFAQAADDHQRKNAEAFVRAGAGRMLVESELSGERVARELKELIDDPATVERMGEASRRLARADAAARIVDLLGELVLKR